jgi:hypothetical protein
VALSERLAYIMTMDPSQAVRGFQQVGDAADKSLEKAESRVDRLGANLTKFGAGAVAVAGVAAVGLVKLGQSASDLGESVNAVNVTFGEAADGVLALGDNAAKSVGLSKTEFNGLAVQFSAFAESVAGKGGDVVGVLDDLTTRGADFASVMNLDVNEAMRLFQAGLAGETEPLRKFGIDLSAAAVEAHAYATGIAETGAKLTETEKVQARYSLLMEQTAKTQGDFANTADSFANRQRILNAELENAKAAIGQGVLPMMEALLGAVSKVTGAFASLSPETQSMIGRFAALGTVGVGLLGTLSLVAGQVLKMRGRFHDADGTLNTFGKTARGLGAAMGVASVAMIAYSINAQEAARNTAALDASYRGLSSVTDAEVFELLRKTIVAADLAGRDLDETFRDMAASNLEGAKRALDAAVANDAEREVVDGLRAAIVAQEAAQRQQTKTTEDYGAAADGATTATNDLTAATDEFVATEEDAKGVVDAVSDLIDDQKRAAEEHEAAVRDARIEVHELKDAFADLRGELSNEAQYLTVEEGFDKVETAARDAYIAAAEGADDAESKAREYQQAIIDQKLAILDYLTALGNVPEATTSRIVALIDRGSIEEAERQLQIIARNRTMELSIIARGGNAFGTGARHVGGRVGPGDDPNVQRGEVFYRDGPMSQAGRVAPRSEAAPTGGGGVTVLTVIEGNVYGDAHLTRMLDERDRAIAARLAAGVRS